MYIYISTLFLVTDSSTWNQKFQEIGLSQVIFRQPFFAMFNDFQEKTQKIKFQVHKSITNIHAIWSTHNLPIHFEVNVKHIWIISQQHHSYSHPSSFKTKNVNKGGCCYFIYFILWAYHLRKYKTIHSVTFVYNVPSYGGY